MYLGEAQITYVYSMLRPLTKDIVLKFENDEDEVRNDVENSYRTQMTTLRASTIRTAVVGLAPILPYRE